jgi:hypothetical protein
MMNEYVFISQTFFQINEKCFLKVFKRNIEFWKYLENCFFFCLVCLSFILLKLFRVEKKTGTKYFVCSVEDLLMKELWFWLKKFGFNPTISLTPSIQCRSNRVDDRSCINFTKIYCVYKWTWYHKHFFRKPGIDFTQLTFSFYECTSQKSKKSCKSSMSFCTIGIFGAKAACKKLVKLTPYVYVFEYFGV